MSNKYKLGSLFDGSGGFPLAGSMCGIQPVWASDVEPYPIAVTRSRFPAMKHLGDISKINGAEIEPVDIVTFGSPCQGLSNAGLQKGLADNRSILFFEAVRVIKEMREATNGVYPRFAVWENVPGAFSSNGGEDFRTVLETLIQIVEPSAVMPPVPKKGWPYADSYCGDGWSLAYRVFDAQYWGVPQRRRRIYLVLDLGDQCAREVLFEREGLRGYFEAGRSPRQGVEANAQNCVRADDREGAGGCVAMTSVSYDARGNGDGRTVSTITGDHEGRITDYTSVVIEPICCIDGDKIGKAERAGGSGLGIRPGDKMYTLTAKDAGCHAVVYGIGNGQANQSFSKEVVGALNCMHDQQAIAQPIADIAAVDCRNMTENQTIFPTLQAKSNGGFSLNFSHAVRIRYIVRRLTPTECARLQGFADRWGVPDLKEDLTDEEYRFWLNVRNTHAAINGKAVKDYTQKAMLKWYNNLHTDSSEYKMWGNGIALPCALYVMQGIVDALDGEKYDKTV